MSSSDRSPYLTATTLDQDFLDNCHDNLSNKLEIIANIETPTGTIYASDINKYVGSVFYEAICVFPSINRLLGEWLSGAIEFSSLQLELSNVDGRFNPFLPSGSGFSGWIGKEVELKIGLRDVSSTYFTIFKGEITDIGGLERKTDTITVIVRDTYDSLKDNFPSEVFDEVGFVDLEDDKIGLAKPIIYGDWTTAVNPDAASIPCFPVNGENAGVLAGTTNLETVISYNTLKTFDNTSVYLYRGDTYYLFDSADITNIHANKNAFDIKQISTGGVTLIEGVKYTYVSGDQFFCKVEGEDLSGYDSNAVWIARHILITYGGLSAGDIDANWETYRDKSTPSESAIASINTRVWIQNPSPIIDYAVSLLSQVRLEAFISRELKLKLNSLHYDDFVSSPTHELKNWDVEKGSFQPKLDERNNFNRANAAFNFRPDKGENANLTPFFKNTAAITQAGRTLSKTIVFPNLYSQATVETQLKEVLKLSSAYAEIITVNTTWRSLLLDLGDFVKLDVDIGSTAFSDVPAMIRNVGHNPQGFSLSLVLWSFQMFPFTGWNPGYSGITGGASATITQE